MRLQGRFETSRHKVPEPSERCVQVLLGEVNTEAITALTVEKQLGEPMIEAAAAPYGSYYRWSALSVPCALELPYELRVEGNAL